MPIYLQDQKYIQNRPTQHIYKQRAIHKRPKYGERVIKLIKTIFAIRFMYNISSPHNNPTILPHLYSSSLDSKF